MAAVVGTAAALLWDYSVPILCAYAVYRIAPLVQGTYRVARSVGTLVAQTTGAATPPIPVGQVPSGGPIDFTPDTGVFRLGCQLGGELMGMELQYDLSKVDEGEITMRMRVPHMASSSSPRMEAATSSSSSFTSSGAGVPRTGT